MTNVEAAEYLESILGTLREDPACSDMRFGIDILCSVKDADGPMDIADAILWITNRAAYHAEKSGIEIHAARRILDTITELWKGDRGDQLHRFVQCTATTKRGHRCKNAAIWSQYPGYIDYTRIGEWNRFRFGIDDLCRVHGGEQR